MNDRAAFVVRRAQPVAGPGIEPGAKSSLKASDQPEQKEPLEPAEEAGSVSSRPALVESGKRTSVDLDTVMLMLDMVKANERDHLKSLIHILNQLSATSRQRVLTIINRIFS